MTTEEADLFCEYYDISELANLSDTIVTNTETTERSASPQEPQTCASTTTTSDAVSDPPADTEVAVACTESLDVKEELLENSVSETRAGDEPAVEYSDCGAQEPPTGADPLALSPREVKLEPLDPDSTDLRLPLLHDVPELFDNHDVCNKEVKVDEVKPSSQMTGCQIVIEEVGYLRVTDKQVPEVKLENVNENFIETACHLCGFNAKNVLGLKIHNALKHEVKQRPLLLDQDCGVNCDNNNTEKTVNGSIETERHTLRRSTVKPSRFTVEVEQRPSKTCKNTYTSSLNVNYKGEILIFSCTTCTYRTGRKTNLWRHFRTQHVKNGPKAINMDLLNIHSNVSWVKKTEYVKIVEFNKYHLGSYQPLDTNKVKPKKKTQQFSCFACDYKSGSRHTLEQHLKEKHVEFATENGSSVSRKVGSQGGQTVSMKTTTKKAPEKQKSLPQIKSVYAESGLKLNDQDVSKLKEIRYSCGKCEFWTRYKQNVVRHYGVIHNTVASNFTTRSVYTCNVCSYDCEHPASMKRHLTLKHQQVYTSRKYETKPVAYVEESVKSKKAKVVENGNAKAGVKRKRDVMENSEPRKNNAKKPKIDSVRQNSNRKFKCSQCTFSTKYELSWKRHVQEVHGNVRTFACKVCGYKFKRRESRNVHYLCYHVPMFGTFLCSNCLFQNTVKDKVRKHISIEHKGRARVLEKK